ncbi:transcriptional regulator [Microaerobacter geothermalis]|uniref:helix-turn-helix transcriptional regulator n=1 Tax=Microaerobacter geothermalis TaxID=674972 RepID=UPI001F3AC759|nr:helix-turn-helix transcriptional regulator [Microaerobacter geothermalis]MCF6095071.1 transcriptional regulator [Microaerobacter geothermalis]
MLLEKSTNLSSLNIINLPDTPGGRLKLSRLKKGMTQVELSNATGISVTAIRQLEKDKSKATLPSLRKLSKALGVSNAYLGCFEKLPEDTLGQKIRKARLYHGFNQKEFAKVLGVVEKTVRKWESDIHKPINIHSENLQHFLKIIKT